jgi:hypothetical protein
VGASPWGFESLQPHSPGGCDVHSHATVLRVLALRQEGLGARRIAKCTGLPLGTVKDWLAGKLPAYSRSGDPGRCASCGHVRHNFPSLPSEYVYLLGLYLGDGCISAHSRGVYRLRVFLDTRYPGIIDSAALAVTRIRGREARVLRCASNCVAVSAYWRSWPCLLPQHGPRKKYERHIALTDWQDELVRRWPNEILRGLIHSDGSRFMNRGRGDWSSPRYQLTQVSDDIKQIFCYACDLMGLHWTRSGDQKVYVSRQLDVARLDAIIGPKA